MMENINNFQQAIKKYGVADIDVFQTVDLWEKKDIAQITNTLFALGRQVKTDLFVLLKRFLYSRGTKMKAHVEIIHS